MEKLLYLFLSVSLSSGRNITTKKTAIDTNVKSQFFLSQTLLFGAGGLLISFFGIKDLTNLSTLTILYGVIYGILLIASQWAFAFSLKIGSAAIGSVIYSLGFILPTVSGAVFWGEDFTVLHLLGIFGAISVILLTARKSGDNHSSNKGFIPFIVLAMLSSGGLGIMQKVQQNSDVSNQSGGFLFIAFTLAFTCTLFPFMIYCEKTAFKIKNSIYPAITGLCFGGANLCNTILAGKMKSAVFFPVQNISTILLTTLLSALLFKEKITKKMVVILLLGVVIIILFSL